MITVLMRLTLVLLCGLAAQEAGRRSSAAMRHLLCLCAMAGSLLILPLHYVPRTAFSFSVPVINRLAASAPDSTHAGHPQVSAIVLCVWILGVIALLSRLALGYWRLRRITRSASPSEPGRLLGDVNVPLACGLLRPTVLLPRAAVGWPETRKAAAVLHEKMHIARGDLWANLIAHLACAIYWFHPLVWLLASRMRKEQEAACDDAVLRAGFDAARYGEALLAVARSTTCSLTLLPASAMSTGGSVRARIERILRTDIVRHTPRITLAGVAVAFGSLLFILACSQPAGPQEVHHMGDGVTASHVLYKVDPSYTKEARDQKIQGPVLLSVVVEPDGLAHDIGVRKGLNPGLDESAIDAIKKWRFAPGQVKGKAVAVRATIQVNFKLL